MQRGFDSLRLGVVGAWCPSLGDTGLVIGDRAPRRCNLTISGASILALPGGMALQFPGGTSTIASNAVAQRYIHGASQATLTAWMYRPTTSSIVACGFADATGANRFAILWFSDGAIYTPAENGNGNYATVSNNVTGWNHIAVAFDGSLAAASRVSIFVNGTSRSVTVSGSFPTALSSSYTLFQLGRDDSSRISNGSIDDVRAFTRVLTPAEIALLASRRGIGLVPLRQRRTSASSKRLYVNVGGTWKETRPYVNVGGVWKEAAVYRRDGTSFKN